MDKLCRCMGWRKTFWEQLTRDSQRRQARADKSPELASAVKRPTEDPGMGPRAASAKDWNERGASRVRGSVLN